MGLSKLFMRAGQIGQMEDLRSRCIRSATVIQRHTRGLVARRRFRRLKAAAIRTQVRSCIVTTVTSCCDSLQAERSTHAKSQRDARLT
jgi:myosin heavy subunit